MMILLVDDEVDIHKTLGLVLEDFGHQVVSAYEGGEALDFLARQESEAVDVVISDVRMPGLDGLKLLEAIRLRRPEMHVTLMTGYGDERIAAEALRHGADDYFRKPLRLETILDHLETLERRRALERELSGGAGDTTRPEC